MTKYQKICATGFLFYKDKVLILKRAKNETFLAGNYELVGGKVDFGESAEQALKREFKEETNLDVEVLEPYSNFHYVSENGERHTIDIQFVVELIGDDSTLKLSPAHDEYKWITEDEIDNYKLSKEMKNVIKKGFKEIML